jgi:hypothetical protein
MRLVAPHNRTSFAKETRLANPAHCPFSFQNYVAACGDLIVAGITSSVNEPTEIINL